MLERIKTAVFLVALVALCMFATSNPLPMVMLMLLCAGIGAKEWANLMPIANSRSNTYKHGFVVLVLGFSVLALFVEMQIVALSLWAASATFWIVSTRWVTQYPQVVTWYKPALYAVGALLLVSTILAIFRLWELSPWWLMYVFILVWSADSGAYFVGRKFGKRKLAPLVSPGKSIEGLWGGMALSCAIAIIISVFVLHYTGLALVAFVALSVLTVIASVLGDLVESMLKRQAGVKDSGTLLPGHGGVLDRIDSLLAAAPIFCLGFFGLNSLFRWV